MPRSRTVIWRNPKELIPHARNKWIYRSPQENEQFEGFVRAMKRAGKFDEDFALTITADDRVICGCTRHAAALKAKLEEVATVLFTPPPGEDAEEAYVEMLVRDNQGRSRDRMMLAREWQALMEIEKQRARRRMTEGGRGGVSSGETGKASDRVGKRASLDGKGVGGKTVERHLKVLDAIDAAAEDGDKGEAERLTKLLNAGKANLALETLTQEKPVTKKPVKVDVPPTMLAYAMKAHSEWYSACAKASIPAELEQLQSYYRQMGEALETARTRVDAFTTNIVAPNVTATEEVPEQKKRKKTPKKFVSLEGILAGTESFEDLK